MSITQMHGQQNIGGGRGGSQKMQVYHREGCFHPYHSLTFTLSHIARGRRRRSGPVADLSDSGDSSVRPIAY